MKSGLALIGILIMLAGCQSVPDGPTELACQSEEADACQKEEIARIRDVRQDIQKVRQSRLKRR